MSSGFAGDYEDITLATFATVADIPQVNELYSLFLAKRLFLPAAENCNLRLSHFHFLVTAN